MSVGLSFVDITDAVGFDLNASTLAHGIGVRFHKSILQSLLCEEPNPSSLDKLPFFFVVVTFNLLSTAL